jgi:hypothetical protein
LWHWPLLAFARVIESGLISFEVRVAAVLASILLAWATYQVIERPIRVGKRRRQKAIVLFLLMGVIGYAGYECYRREGLSFRVQDRVDIANLFKAYPHEPFHNGNCDSRFPAFKIFSACLLSKPSPPRVVIVGDSHSNHYYKSLEKQLPGYSVMNIGGWGCLPFSSNTHQSKDKCAERIDIVRDFLMTNDSIEVVYLAGFWAYLAAGGYGINEGGWRLPRSLAAKEGNSFLESGKRFIGGLVSARKTVVFMYDIPSLDLNVKSCANLRPFRLSPRTSGECAIDRRGYENRAAEYERLLSRLLERFPEVDVYDPKPIFCDDKLCWAKKGTDFLYWNSDHLTIYGADLVVSDMLSKYPLP